MARKKVDVITLGCSKNLVDSERLMSMFDRAGFEARHEPENLGGDIVVVNTCGFIGDAKEESVNTILEQVEAKKEGRIKSLYVMGCLSQRYHNELVAEIPEVDGWYGKFNWPELVNTLTNKFPATSSYDRVITTPSHFAYVKIAEGCNRFCSFCAIPLITGRFKSRPIEEILDEVSALVKRGVHEFNIIAQDLSSYGLDLYNEMRLPQLIDRMASIEGVEWIRLHYAYPAQFPMEILDVMARHDNVCKYLDIALQHISDKVLKNMRRHITGDETKALLDEIRRKVPGIHIRTTLMVGFPGEGEEEFSQLKEFVRQQRFERMGAFAYCEEEDTFGAKNFEDSIPEEVKQSRLNELMAIQEEIALESNQSKIGKRLRVIIDKEEDDYYVGRTQWDSPEVDPEVLVKKTEKLEKGHFYDVDIIDALPYELIAQPSLQ
ncbi:MULTISPECIES: 30S ribosomal protein S12 methylthiotransferase RimO [Muribaculum]|jgi:ribosomal protein S12 methylthiotransferase rimO|uniref:30S ribosomal protein S12 methylthiotransferase RimO n=5 Tax=Muribaculaceae TaxID=2005473 RepID=UPI000F46B01C|nr:MULTISPECIES: 30S ribosomal protein S12 methylthiotransferase RimO [Muribaculum]MCX4276254.1 30S ribosomal protein S12 methylthiotransferase RimO [Muribaculum sp.]ROT13984.1 30S ribosomal protein S12 methylthiotransferase RimO [Muribaculaceae bacterium Isolate-102 (HZI)]